MPVKLKKEYDPEDKLNLRKLQQSASLEGREGGQTLYGGAKSGEDLTLYSNKSKDGKILFGDDSAYDESNTRLGLGTISPSDLLEVQSSSGASITLNNPATGGSSFSRLILKAGTSDWRILNIENKFQVYEAGFSLVTPLLAATQSGNVGVGTKTPNASAKLDVTSTSSGFLPPRMTTTQRNNISSPAAGLIIFNTTTSKHEGYDGSTWNAFY